MAALSNAERQKRYRDRRNVQKTVLTQHQQQAVERIVDAGTAARVTRDDANALWSAFEAGLAARVFHEITQGMTGGEELLASWLSSNPPGLWLFHVFLSEQGLWGQFDAWSGSRSA